MAKKNAVATTLVALAVAVAVVVAASAGVASANCNIAHLASCKPAVVGGSKPTAMCCSSLRAQEACLCKYQNDPKFRKYVNPKARKMVTSCGLPIPNC